MFELLSVVVALAFPPMKVPSVLLLPEADAGDAEKLLVL
jgi:hypothetical protein